MTDELVRMALSGMYVFHGSPAKFDLVRASPTTRTGSDAHGRRYVKYRGTSVHASAILGVALGYCGIKDPDHMFGSNLYAWDNSMTIYGPKDLGDSLRRLYGRRSYVYVLPKQDFTWFHGLGTVEVASFRESIEPVKRFSLTYAQWKKLMDVLNVEIRFQKTA